MTASAPIARRPSIGDDGDTVLAAHAVTGTLPDWITPDSADALIAHGYARHDDHRGYTLTDTGIALRDRYAAIRRDTATRAYGPLTPPSPGEIRDARDHDVPLHWARQRPTA